MSIFLIGIIFGVGTGMLLFAAGLYVTLQGDNRNIGIGIMAVAGLFTLCLVAGVLVLIVGA